MRIEDLTIGQAREVARLISTAPAGPAPDQLAPEQCGLQIVVLDRGWVYVGRVTLDGDWVIIEDARCVRRWGTTRGLGEIATGGPTPETQLDPCPTVRAPRRALIHLISCEESAWNAR